MRKVHYDFDPDRMVSMWFTPSCSTRGIAPMLGSNDWSKVTCNICLREHDRMLRRR